MEKIIVIGKRKTESGKRRAENGFSLLELLIAMFIIIILLAVALPTYQRSVQQARETVLSENLFQMRRMIDQYAADKGKLPQSLNDLVDAKYMREVPTDPITEKKIGGKFKAKTSIPKTATKV